MSVDAVIGFLVFGPLVLALWGAVGLLGYATYLMIKEDLS